MKRYSINMKKGQLVIEEDKYGVWVKADEIIEEMKDLSDNITKFAEPFRDASNILIEMGKELKDITKEEIGAPEDAPEG